MNCPRENLTWVEFKRTEWGVEGCGPRVTYVEVCTKSTGFDRHALS